ncbi:MAG: MarR family winged helix-turn-helix transcriptional regulator [Anaerovoracaceae bacterium]
MDIKNSAGTMIKQINEALERDANNSMREIGLTVSQLSILLYMQENNENILSLKEIEESMHCAKSTAHGLVTRMKRKGLLEDIENPEDHRVRQLKITDKGIGYCLKAREKMESAEDRLFSKMTDEEHDEFVRLLAKVRDGIM